MSSRLNMTNSVKVFLILASLAVAGMIPSNSQGAMFTYKGAMLHQGAAIPVVEGAHPVDYFVTRDVAIDYRYVRTGDHLDLSGVAQYEPSIRHSFKTVPRFYLRLYFADAKGVVLGYRGIVTSGYGYSDDELRFKERIALPPVTALMAFGYDGEARGTGQGKGGAWPFWLEPVAR
jgi:hypothetical protein